jgi:protoheme IX farnesyltransferase
MDSVKNQSYKRDLPWAALLRAKLIDYLQLAKVRLSLTVVFSAIMGYFIALAGAFEWTTFLALLGGGALLTFGANAANQVMERSFDAMMKRTKDRPLAAGRMRAPEGSYFAAFCVVGAAFLLFHGVNPLAAMIALLSFLLYAFVYTPMKRLSPVSVFVGAIPGALPPTIGVVAATGEFAIEACILFGIQFFWQFPHFWAIAWLANEDYTRAGYKMLPAGQYPNRRNAAQIVIYALLLLPLGLMPVAYGLAGTWSAVPMLAGGLLMLLPGLMLWRTLARKWAVRTFLASLLYLPIILLAILFL